MLFILYFVFSSLIAIYNALDRMSAVKELDMMTMIMIMCLACVDVAIGPIRVVFKLIFA
jgi:hypothetical protein